METVTLQVDKNTYTYLDEGQGHPIVLLHGLFGELSNWQTVIDEFSASYRIILPRLPIYERERKQATIEGLSKYFKGFLDALDIPICTLIGNSLGGHLALHYTFHHKEKVDKMILVGSSGLFENNHLGTTFPRRGDYQYIQERVRHTFYDPNSIDEDYINNIFQSLQSISNCLKFISMARSAQRHNMSKELPLIETPTMLIWGLNDTITPPEVAFEFHKLLKNSSIVFYDNCSHVPMMEQPQKFNRDIAQFLRT